MPEFAKRVDHDNEEITISVSASSWGLPRSHAVLQAIPCLNHPGDHGQIDARIWRTNLWSRRMVQYLAEKDRISRDRDSEKPHAPHGLRAI